MRAERSSPAKDDEGATAEPGAAIEHALAGRHGPKSRAGCLAATYLSYAPTWRFPWDTNSTRSAVRPGCAPRQQVDPVQRGYDHDLLGPPGHRPGQRMRCRPAGRVDFVAVGNDGAVRWRAAGRGERRGRPVAGDRPWGCPADVLRVLTRIRTEAATRSSPGRSSRRRPPGRGGSTGPRERTGRRRRDPRSGRRPARRSSSCPATQAAA